MYASKTRKEKFSGPGENCQRNVTDLAGKTNLDFTEARDSEW